MMICNDAYDMCDDVCLRIVLHSNTAQDYRDMSVIHQPEAPLSIRHNVKFFKKVNAARRPTLYSLTNIIHYLCLI